MSAVRKVGDVGSKEGAVMGLFIGETFLLLIFDATAASVSSMPHANFR